MPFTLHYGEDWWWRMSSKWRRDEDDRISVYTEDVKAVHNSRPTSSFSKSGQIPTAWPSIGFENPVIAVNRLVEKISTQCIYTGVSVSVSLLGSWWTRTEARMCIVDRGVE